MLGRKRREAKLPTRRGFEEYQEYIDRIDELEEPEEESFRPNPSPGDTEGIVYEGYQDLLRNDDPDIEDLIPHSGDSATPPEDELTSDERELLDRLRDASTEDYGQDSNEDLRRS